MEKVLRFLMDERGSETVEWAIVIAMIAVGAIAAAISIGTKVNNAFNNLDEGMVATTPVFQQ
jgi:Flp pilus assembly pilin Flp